MRTLPPTLVAAATMLVCAAASHADVKPGDVITRDNVAAAADLLPRRLHS